MACTNLLKDSTATQDKPTASWAINRRLFLATNTIEKNCIKPLVNLWGLYDSDGRTPIDNSIERRAGENKTSDIAVYKQNTSSTTMEQKSSYVQCDDKMTQEFLQIVANDYFESGYTSISESYVSRAIEEDPVLTRDWISKLFLNNIQNEHVVIGILHILSHLDYDQVYPQAQIMAIAGLSHKSAEIREYAIKAFENWANPDSVSILKAINCPEKWLQEYLLQVIADLERESIKNGITS